MTEHLLVQGDLNLFYRVYGEGKPVVALHGLGIDGKVWDKLARTLETKYRFIVPDIPGSGRSTRKDGDWSIEMLADDLLLMLEKENIDRCTMIGHSMGGYITLAFAEKYPDRLVSFGLFHSTAFADSEERKATRRKHIDFINKNGSGKFLAEAIPNFFSETFKVKEPLVIKDLITHYANFSPVSLVRYNEAMIQRPDRTHILESFKGAILFLAGENDTIIPLEQTLKQCKIPEFAYIYVAVQSAHMGMLEEAGFCARSIYDFLSYDELV